MHLPTNCPPSPAFLLHPQMAVGFKKCRKYFDMLDSNGDRCVGRSLSRAAKQPQGPVPCMHVRSCGQHISTRHGCRKHVLSSGCSSVALPCCESAVRFSTVLGQRSTARHQQAGHGQLPAVQPHASRHARQQQLYKGSWNSQTARAVQRAVPLHPRTMLSTCSCMFPAGSSTCGSSQARHTSWGCRWTWRWVTLDTEIASTPAAATAVEGAS